jgi:drug/metabolite transporter (DMT)-like permease
MAKLLLLILLHDTILATGQMFIRRGMRPMEDIKLLSFRGILHFLKYCVTNANIWAAITLNSSCLVIWLIILSFADLSQAFPLDSMQYLIITVFSIVFLKEKVNRLRWVGIAVIIIGIIVTGLK